MKRFLVLALLAVPALLLARGSARAEPITWSFAWSASPGAVTSNDGSLGKVTFHPGSNGPLTGSWQGILDSNLTAAAPAAGTATFTDRSYSLTMHLTDLKSNTSGDLTFGGALSGTLGAANNLTNKFLGKPAQTITLGGNQYTVAVGLFIPPVPGTPGRLGANVTVISSGAPPPPVNTVPEPASLLLAAFGGSAVGLRAWWRRRGAKG
jgi:hypothetical protein